MSTTAQRHAEPGTGRGPAPRRRWSLLLSALLLVGWAAHALASWLGGYQTVPLATLQHELDTGTVTGYVVVQDEPRLGDVRWWAVIRPEPAPLPWSQGAAGTQPVADEPVFPSGMEVVYTVRDDRPRVAVPSWGLYGPPQRTWADATAEETEWIRTRLLTSDVPRGPHALELGRTGSVALVLGPALLAGVLAHLLLGPAPRHGTRWFWFWLLGLPGGIGVVGYALWEVAGLREHRVPAPGLRSDGVYGVVVLLLAGMLASLSTGILLVLVGATVTPL
ncbi:MULTISPECIES: hypothetical protein [unclassified Ornithinimicrobium]|uniref:hypothetical protein n=1 Tax=unclassified Ornithinimicrobium TaxID=2615080 RepID=UPI00385314BE